jgi:hypothetical protein
MGNISIKPRPLGLSRVVFSVFPILVQFTFELKVARKASLPPVEASSMPCRCEAADICVLSVVIDFWLNMQKLTFGNNALHFA